MVKLLEGVALLVGLGLIVAGLSFSPWPWTAYVVAGVFFMGAGAPSRSEKG